MNKASYRYTVVYKDKSTDRLKLFVTGYVPTGLKMSELKKYIQGSAEDKKIQQIIKVTQRYYYHDIPAIGADGSIDITDEELYTAQVASLEAEQVANDSTATGPSDG